MALDLSSFLKGATRVAVVGIGSELRADDAAGIEVVRRLQKRLASPKVMLIDAGIVPENFLGSIKRFKPSHILLIDATDFGDELGSVMLAEPDAIVGKPLSTHRLPLSILASYLRNQTRARIALLGIQPKDANLGGQMSNRVKLAVIEVSTALSKVLRSL